MAKRARSLWKRVGDAASGLNGTFKTEANFRLQILLGALGALIFIQLRASAIWWAVFFVSAAGVLAAEVFNTAIEKLADHIQPAEHPEIKIVKDAAAGAVLIASFAAGLVFVCFLV